METTTKPLWEKLPAEHRQAWIQQVINFYLPAVISAEEADTLARDEYSDAETLLPVPDPCEAD